MEFNPNVAQYTLANQPVHDKFLCSHYTAYYIIIIIII
jgi:hypothetical protein